MKIIYFLGGLVAGVIAERCYKKQVDAFCTKAKNGVDILKEKISSSSAESATAQD